MANFEVIGKKYPSGGDTSEERLIFIDNLDGTFTLTVSTGDGTYPSSSGSIVAGSGIIVAGTTVSEVTSVTNSDGTLTISPNTGAVIASLNLNHANSWTANQTFGSGNLRATRPQFTTSIDDSAGNKVIGITPTASAVDFLNITNGAAGTPGVVVVAATGTDAAVTLSLQSKGTGLVVLAPGSNSTTAIQLQNSAGAVVLSAGYIVNSPITGTDISDIASSGSATLAAVIELHNVYAIPSIESFSHAATAGRGSEIDIFRSGGTQAAPTVATNGMKLGSFNLGGYDGTTNIGNSNLYTGYFNSVLVQANATETWNGTSHGSKLALFTTPNTTLTAAVALTLDQDQSAAFAGALSVTGTVSLTSKITKYNNVNTAGGGVPAILGFTSQKSETTTPDANVLTVTPPATAGTYRVSVAISVSSATNGVISWTLSYTDSNGNAQSNVAQQIFQQGTAAPNTTFTTSAAGNYYGSVVIDINNGAANIVVKWVGGGTTAAKMSASIERLN